MSLTCRSRKKGFLEYNTCSAPKKVREALLHCLLLLTIPFLQLGLKSVAAGGKGAAVE